MTRAGVHDPAKGAFGTIAGTCVHRHVRNARLSAYARKHRVLTEAASLHERASDAEAPTLLERLAGPEADDPARVFELREHLRTLAAERRWRARVTRSSSRRLYSETQIAHALSMVAGGSTLHEAGAAVGAAHTTVMQWLRNAA